MKFVSQHIVLKNGRNLILREAIPSDAAELLRYIEQLSGETGFLSMEPGEFSLTEEQEAQYLQQCSASLNQIYLVAEVDGVLVGTGTLSASTRMRIRHVCELGMSVKKDYWSWGIGRSILSALISWTQKNPILTKMDLSVREDNSRAIALYQSLGFVEEGRHRRRMFHEGVFYDTIIMGLDL